jgi:hypothetical protein
MSCEQDLKAIKDNTAELNNKIDTLTNVMKAIYKLLSGKDYE